MALVSVSALFFVVIKYGLFQLALEIQLRSISAFIIFLRQRQQYLLLEQENLNLDSDGYNKR